MQQGIHIIKLFALTHESYVFKPFPDSFNYFRLYNSLTIFIIFAIDWIRTLGL